MTHDTTNLIASSLARLGALGWRLLVLMIFFPLPAFLLVALVTKISGMWLPVYAAGAVAVLLVGVLAPTAIYAIWRGVRDWPADRS